MPSTSFRDPTTFPTGTVRLRTWVDGTGVTKNVVSCGSCHNAHGKGFPNLLVMSNAGSALCLTCHIK
jgi:predicted CXXCH cytochrome family protein